MIREKYSVIIMMIALSMGQVALAQKVEHVKRFEPVSKLQNQTGETPAGVENQTTVQVDSIPETPPVPQDRLDTIYYNKNWKVTPNKAFATYYRLALYPADTTSPKEFRTYYMSGELQGEGSFAVIDKKDDAKSEFIGAVTTYFKNGKVETQKNYQSGLLTGEYTSYFNNGNVKEHFFMNEGKKTGVGASFSENGRVCTLTPYKNDVPEGFYVVVDADGNYSKYSLSDRQPILEVPSQDEIVTEYKNGVAWPYYNKNGLIVGVSNSVVDENIGDYREIGLFIVNKSMINVDIDPAQIEIYDMKGGKRKNFELVSADEYDEKIKKFKKKVAKRSVKNKAVVETERENNVNANLGAQVFDAGTSNTLKDFQTRICRMQQLESGNRMKYSDKMPEDLGYLERTTIHPGEVVSGYLYTSDRKTSDLFVKVKIKGIDYVFEWKTSKKK